MLQENRNRRIREQRRGEVLGALAEHVLAVGLQDATVRSLARGAGISDRMLLYYFKDRNDVVAAALATIAARLQAMLETAASAPMPVQEVYPVLAQIILSEGMRPYMRVWLELLAKAAGGEGLSASVAHQIGQGFSAWCSARVLAETDQEAARLGAVLFARLEGLVVLAAAGLDEAATQAAQHW